MYHPHTPAAEHPAALRHDGWSGARKVRFLEEFIEQGVASRALQTVGKGVSGLYAMRARDPAFAAAWDAARMMVRERLFDTLIGQAFEGEEHVVIKDEGETRHRKRNYRLGMGMLDRLQTFQPVELAPLFAHHFEEVCAMIARDADPSAWRDWLDRYDPKCTFFGNRAICFHFLRNPPISSPISKCGMTPPACFAPTCRRRPPSRASRSAASAIRIISAR